MTDNTDGQDAEPISTLKKFVGKKILVKLKNDETIQGVLKNFDQHMNLILTDTDNTSNQGTKHYSEIVLRGSNVLAVSLEKIILKSNDGKIDEG